MSKIALLLDLRLQARMKVARVPMTARNSITMMLGVMLAVCADPSGQQSNAQDAIASMYAQRLQSLQSAPSPDETANAYLADVADDAVWMPQNALPIEGREAIPDWAAEFFDILGLQADGTWKLTLHMWSSNNSGQSIYRI